MKLSLSDRPRLSQTYAAMALKEAMGKSKRPPNLRQGSRRGSCSGCRSYSRGTCKRYGYSVRADQTCDSYASGRAKEAA